MLSLDLRKGAGDRLHARADAGVAGFGGTIEGPVPGGAFLLTAHRSFTNLVYKLFAPEQTSAPAYSSLVGKLDFDAPADNRFSILGIYASDDSHEKGPTWDWAYRGNQQVGE